jgi:hypothetical protein
MAGSGSRGFGGRTAAKSEGSMRLAEYARGGRSLENQPSNTEQLGSPTGKATAQEAATRRSARMLSVASGYRKSTRKDQFSATWLRSGRRLDCKDRVPGWLGEERKRALAR